MNHQIHTERLILRPIEPEDAPAIFEYGSNPNVTQWVTWETHKSIDDAHKFIQMVFQNESFDVLTFAICLKESPTQMMGDVSVFWRSRRDKTVEIGAVLAEKYWGNGYVTEALKGLVDFSIKELDVVRIQGRCMKGNLQSKRMMEKVGMEYEGTLKSSLFVKENFWDMEMYSVIRKGPY